MDKSGGHPEAAAATSIQAADHPGGGGAAPTLDLFEGAEDTGVRTGAGGRRAWGLPCRGQ